MRVKIIGGGPAGLYAAYLIKQQQPAADVIVYEQNDANTTFGFGVVFSDKALGFLSAGDAETLRLITTGLETWEDIEIRIHGESIRIDGVGFASVARLHLLTVLRQRAASAGVSLVHDHIVRSLEELGEADLIIGADGANSLVRQKHQTHFGTEIHLLTNRFAWFGATKAFDRLTQTFKALPEGNFTAHHYRYSPKMSTFLVEVDEHTFHKVGLSDMDEEGSRRYCEAVFAEELDGAQLITNKSIWRRFPIIRNKRWSVGNCVLVGDALRTAHFSIGSGTRLALEDVQALAHALAAHPASIADAVTAFEAQRRPIVDKLAEAAARSANWYEHFPEHMRQPAWDFALSYIGRSGRVDPKRLQAMSPRFVAGYETSRKRSVITP